MPDAAIAALALAKMSPAAPRRKLRGKPRCSGSQTTRLGKHRRYASLPKPYGKAAAVAGDEVRHLMAGGPEVQTDLQKVWASFWALKNAGLP